MDIDQYQLEATKTDQAPGREFRDTVIPLLGLSGEVGSLVTEYKKRLRDGPAYRIFKERIAEELGDILWYVANVATKEDLSLTEIAETNLRKVRNRWERTNVSAGGPKLLDADWPPNEQLPRQFKIDFEQVVEGAATKVRLQMGGQPIGSQLTDNAYADDGYRFHDVFHIGFAAMLGWSPVLRALMKRKRKSDPRVDEVEDGGRAVAIEEGISALVFDYAKDHSFFDGVDTIDFGLLRMVANLTSRLEVRVRSLNEWERAILNGYRVWRLIRQHGRGAVVADLIERRMDYEQI